jgi:AraC-like DNA-binding protein
MSLIDIAIQSGFSNQAAFTRTFHQLVGVARKMATALHDKAFPSVRRSFPCFETVAPPGR